MREAQDAIGFIWKVETPNPVLTQRRGGGFQFGRWGRHLDDTLQKIAVHLLPLALLLNEPQDPRANLVSNFGIGFRVGISGL